MKRVFLFLIIFCLFFVSCGDLSAPPILGVAPTRSPLVLKNKSSSFYKDIPYGERPRNKLDFISSGTAEVSPLLILIHGGGFVAGDKSVHYSELGFQKIINTLLKEGISFASINYQYVEEKEEEGITRSLKDCKRALQFIRYNSKEFNIDKDRIALFGISAGAVSSLWLGVNDDMADSTSSDDILKESTRVSGLVLFSLPASFDFKSYSDTIFSEYKSDGFDFDAIRSIVGDSLILRYYGVSSIEELDSVENQAYRAQFKLLDFLTIDDPEAYIVNADVPYAYPKRLVDLGHHPLHAKAFKDKADSLSIESKVYIPSMNINTTEGETPEQFIIRKLRD